LLRGSTVSPMGFAQPILQKTLVFCASEKTMALVALPKCNLLISFRGSPKARVARTGSEPDPAELARANELFGIWADRDDLIHTQTRVRTLPHRLYLRSPRPPQRCSSLWIPNVRGQRLALGGPRPYALYPTSLPKYSLAATASRSICSVSSSKDSNFFSSRSLRRNSTSAWRP